MSETLPGLKRNRVRLSVRILCLLAAVATLWFLVSPWVLSLSPFVAICSVIATRSFPTLAWLGVLVGIVAMAKHRIFCRWVCPMGLC
ncbi:MAG TPA: hypothetical protein PLS24_05580, partial [Sedimentisphaerales bacterium]|nr:hypothetical protein [Sedimentisphaerales bacterium]